MFTTNLGTLDRMLRIVIGAVLLFLALTGTIGGAIGTVVAVLAGIAILTGIVGWCALYALLGISTNGRRSRHA